jgi:AcrR family transcriptional regulator
MDSSRRQAELDGLISRMERKKQEARERILAAAQKLFVVDQRYERVTIREIAELADVSVGAVYLHFKTKGRSWRSSYPYRCGGLRAWSSAA